MSEALSATECLSKHIKCSPEEFKFIHLMLNHRVQWYMMYCLLQKLQKKEMQDVDDMWALYQLLFGIHSSVEETELIAQLSNHAKSVSDKVHAEHEALIPMIAELEKARKESSDAFGEKLKVFAAKYHEHTMLEERELLPVCHSINPEKREAMTRAFKDHFKSQPDNAWLILSMRDVASFSGDQALWDLSMPWFFRTVIAPFLGFNSTYAKYTKLFPPATSSDWLGSYAAMLQ